MDNDRTTNDAAWALVNDYYKAIGREDILSKLEGMPVPYLEKLASDAFGSSAVALFMSKVIALLDACDAEFTFPAVHESMVKSAIEKAREAKPKKGQRIVTVKMEKEFSNTEFLTNLVLSGKELMANPADMNLTVSTGKVLYSSRKEVYDYVYNLISGHPFLRRFANYYLLSRGVFDVVGWLSCLQVSYGGLTNLPQGVNFKASGKNSFKESLELESQTQAWFNRLELHKQLTQRVTTT